MEIKPAEKPLDFLFKLTRDSVRLTQGAIRRGELDEGIKYFVSTPGYFLLDVVLLPLEVTTAIQVAAGRIKPP